MIKKILMLIICFIYFYTFSQAENNTPPNAYDDYYTVDEDKTLDIKSPGLLANDNDPDKSFDKLKVKITKDVEYGRLMIESDGSFRYMPEHDIYNKKQANIDSVQFSYKVFDGKSYSNEAIVYITINQINDPPQCMDDFYSTDENRELNVNSSHGVLGNDHDPEGDSLYAVLDTDVQNGILDFNDDGSFIYTPNEGYSGEDRFTYYVSDGELDSKSTSVIIDIMANDEEEDIADSLSDEE